MGDEYFPIIRYPYIMISHKVSIPEYSEIARYIQVVYHVPTNYLNISVI